MTLRSLAAVFLFSALPAAAGVNRWTEGSPPHAACDVPGPNYCSEVTSIALDPFDERVIYAAMSSGPFQAADRHGLWRSDDGGTSWVRLPLQLDNAPVSVGVAKNGALYVLSKSSFHRSLDGGRTWTHSSLPVDYVNSTDLAVDPRNGNTLFVSQENFCWLGCTGGGVWRSDDGGNHWKAIGLGKTFVSRVAVDPTDSSTVYATTFEGQLFQTRNGGGSWKDVTPGGPISMVVVDPIVPSTVYAVTGTFAQPFTGVFKSTDRAKSWRLIQDARLKDGGTTTVIAIDPVRPLNLLATMGYGTVVRSVDGGESWSLFDDGLAGFFRSQLVIAPSGGVFHAVLENGFIYHYTLVPPRRRASR